MDVFVSNLSESITKTINAEIMKALRQKLTAFASAVSDATDGKVSVDDVMEMWGKIDPDFKAKKTKAKTVSSSDSDGDGEQKSSSGCVAICVSGMKKGEACGKICKDGNDKCGIHLKASQEVKVSPVEEEKTEKPVKLTVPQLKKLADEKGLQYGSKITRTELIALLETDPKEQSSSAEKSVEEKKIDVDAKFEKLNIAEMTACLSELGIATTKARPSRAELLEKWHTRVSAESKESALEFIETTVKDVKGVKSKKGVEKSVIDPKITVENLKQMFAEEGLAYPKGNKANAIEVMVAHLTEKKNDNDEETDEETEEDGDETEEEIEEVEEEEVEEIDEEELRL